MSTGSDAGVDLGNIRYVKRVALGGKDLQVEITEADREQQMELLNKCLSGIPPGRIIALEISTRVFKLGDLAGEHHVSLQMLTYHVGFERKPYWLDDGETSLPHGMGG